MLRFEISFVSLLQLIILEQKLVCLYIVIVVMSN